MAGNNTYSTEETYEVSPETKLHFGLTTRRQDRTGNYPTRWDDDKDFALNEEQRILGKAIFQALAPHYSDQDLSGYNVALEFKQAKRSVDVKILYPITVPGYESGYIVKLVGEDGARSYINKETMDAAVETHNRNLANNEDVDGQEESNAPVADVQMQQGNQVHRDHQEREDELEEIRTNEQGVPGQLQGLPRKCKEGEWLSQKYLLNLIIYFLTTGLKSILLL